MMNEKLDKVFKDAYGTIGYDRQIDEQKQAIIREIEQTVNVKSYRGHVVLALATLLILIALGFAYGYLNRNYNVWSMEMQGKAKLAEATQSRQIDIEAAKAKNESSIYEAKAEITRAKGVAEANKIIGSSLKDNDAYLRYLWVNQLNKNKQNVIYIPTEAGMPILEAGKR